MSGRYFLEVWLVRLALPSDPPSNPIAAGIEPAAIRSVNGIEDISLNGL
jgi:hypothetical protein